MKKKIIGLVMAAGVILSSLLIYSVGNNQIKAEEVANTGSKSSVDPSSLRVKFPDYSQLPWQSLPLGVHAFNERSFDTSSAGATLGWHYGRSSDKVIPDFSGANLEELKMNLDYGVTPTTELNGYVPYGTSGGLFNTEEEEPIAGGWTVYRRGFPVSSAPIIFAQGDKVIEPLSQFGHGDPNLNQPAAIASNVKVYTTGTAIPEKAIKVEYELKNNPAVKTANMFEFHVKVESVARILAGKTVSANSLKVTNLSEKKLENFVLGSQYDIDLLGTYNRGYGQDVSDNTLPVKFLGHNRGVKYTAHYLKRTKYVDHFLLNFYFDTLDKPDNWSVKQIRPLGQVESFYDPAYSGFSGPTASGQENNNTPAPAGSIAYSAEQKDPKITAAYNTALYMKNQPVDLEKNQSTGYTFNTAAGVMDAKQPLIFVDSPTAYYTGESPQKVSGTVMDYKATTTSLDVMYSFNAKGPFKKATTVSSYVPGVDKEWSFEIPTAELAPITKEKIVYLKTVNNGNVESTVVQQLLEHNVAPTLTADKSVDWFMTGSSYTINGQWKEADGDAVSLYYSLDGGAPKQFESSLVNSPANTDRKFSSVIAAAELGDTAHQLSVWAEDSRTGESAVETWTISPHNQPNASANLAIATPEIFEGETVVFTSTFQNSAPAPSIWRDVLYETTEVFPEHVKVDTTTVKLNGQAIAATDIEFGADRKLKVKLGEIKPGIEMNLTYNVMSEISNPPILTPIEVNQAYKVSGITADETVVTAVSGELKGFTIKPRIAEIKISHVKEGSDPETSLASEPVRSGLIGTEETVSAKAIDGYILSKVTIDGVEQTPYANSAKVKFGESSEVKFYYQNKPNLTAKLDIALPEISEGEKVTFTSTIQNTVAAPSVLNDVLYKTTEAFPENVDVDLTSVKLNGQAIPKENVVLGSARRLNVKLGQLEPSIEYKLTYDVVSKITTPPLMTPLKVDQAYTVTGKNVDASVSEASSGALQSFTIKPRIDSIYTLHLEEGSERELAEEPDASGIVGEKVTISAKKIDGYVLSKVLIDEVEQETVSNEVTVTYGENYLVEFYYTGVLEIKSAPTGFDFGVVPSSYEKVRVESALAKGDPLVITDNRLGNQNWTLNATLTTPLSNKSGKILPDVIRYKNGNEEIKLRGEGMPIVTRETTTTGDYSISDTWSSTGDGFKMEVAPGIVNELGNYHAEILFEMGITP
ncbi:hypothetical protein ATZ33_14700 [Enterococcus silesiacus]|uniref:MucBP domain-containing protein n=1 Tax=Enterococcus silesiacus TaxID=332949 RepID=A0A0S3KEF8_9ENTE|nr:MucBP domain-containing protein [Enterococcus silesiacus]ALS02580.1 hypothetical protein ATZ33_14700 [Enterococcus silesiacus]OJG93498.1 hypothetical protein RV15_GL000100 [Enterococcus silesiacus]